MFAYKNFPKIIMHVLIVIAIGLIVIASVLWLSMQLPVPEHVPVPVPVPLTSTKQHLKTSKHKYYQLLDKMIENKDQTISNFRKAGQLYLDGIPDVYDITGKKHTGVKPDITKSIEYFKKAARLGDNQSLLSIAKIYHYGLGNTVENLPEAERYYQYISSDPDLKTEVNANMLVLYKTMSNDRIYEWLNLSNPRHTKIKPVTTATATAPSKISINKIYRANTIKNPPPKKTRLSGL